VKRGDVLLTLDAMKMVNAIRAPRDAVVAEVLVAVGQIVAFGDPLMRFEG
jgi:biotin carboxyl carrier protein